MEPREEIILDDDIISEITGPNARTVTIEMNRLHPCEYWSDKVENVIRFNDIFYYPFNLVIQFGENFKKHFVVFFDINIKSLNIAEYDYENNIYYCIPLKDNLLCQISYIKIMLWEVYCIRPCNIVYTNTIQKDMLYDITKWAVALDYSIANPNPAKEFFIKVSAPSKEDVCDHDIRAILIQQVKGEKYKFEVEIIYMNYSSYKYIERKELRFKSTKALLNFLYYDIGSLGGYVV